MNAPKKKKARKTWHQHCNCCGYDWDSIKEFPKACPNCKRYDHHKEEK